MPINGERTGDEFNHGSRISFSCKQGFLLIGNSSSVCNMGKWNNALPQCKGGLWFWEHYPKQKMHINTLLHVLFGSIRIELKKVEISYFCTGFKLNC